MAVLLNRQGSLSLRPSLVLVMSDLNLLEWDFVFGRLVVIETLAMVVMRPHFGLCSNGGSNLNEVRVTVVIINHRTRTVVCSNECPSKVGCAPKLRILHTHE